jgi:chromosomal replication initiation ATPase DnaA
LAKAASVTLRARQAVMRRLRDDGFAMAQIGRWMNRDHTTVLHAVRKGAM